MAGEREDREPQEPLEGNTVSSGRSAGLRRGTYLNIFGAISFLAMVVFGLYHLLGPEWEVKPVLGVVELAFGALTAGVLLFLRLTQNLRFAVNTALFLTLGLLAVLLFSGGVAGTGLFWWYCMPAAAFYLKGSRGGWAWVGASLVLLGGAYGLSEAGLLVLPYPPAVLRQGLVSYVVVSLLIYAFEVLRGDYERILLRKNQQISAAARRLAEESEARSRALEALERARDEAERANRAKSEFLSRMSHELRTPLNAILGFTELLLTDRREPPTAAQREALETVLGSGRHLLGLIGEILDLARVEAGRLEVASVPLNPAPLVEECLRTLAPAARERSVRLIQEPPEGRVPPAVGDPVRIRQILLNLLSNAVKYNRENGQVRVALQREGDRVALSVADTGPGMEASEAERVFEPFERLGADRKGIPGTGIGLSLSRRLARLMGGDLQVESTPGVGSRFTLFLPAAPAASDEGSAAASPGTVPFPEAAAGARRTVLYVEDDGANVALVRRILERRPELRLLVAGTVREGLEAARRERPSVLLLDLHLPDGNGLEIPEALQKEGEAVPPVVVVSASAMPHEVSRVLERGVSAYLTKPLDIGRFLEALDGALGEVEAARRTGGGAP
ncbi:MAG: ATP-binding response regulator [Acidobacteriota bacterium]